MPAAKRIGAAALAAAVCACVALGGARAEDKGGKGDRAPKPANDREFVLMASAGGLAEVDAANLALKQTKNEDVRRFAQHMLDDHTKANDQLNRVADRKRIPVARSADQAHQQMATRMATLSGADFDRRYLNAQVRDHQRTADLLEWGSKNAQDPDLKSWAEKTLPTVRDHLKMARDLDGKVGGRGDREGTSSDRAKDRAPVSRDKAPADKDR